MLITRKILATIWVISFVLVIGSSFGLIDPFSLLFWAAITAMGLIAIHTNIYQREWYRRLRSVACRWLIIELSKRLKHEDQAIICIHNMMTTIHTHRAEKGLSINTESETVDLHIVSIIKPKGELKYRMDEFMNKLKMKQFINKAKERAKDKSPEVNN